MPGRIEIPRLGIFTADAAYAPYCMKLGASATELTVAGDEDHIGVLERRTHAAGDEAALYHKNAPGTQCYIGNGAIGANVNVFAAAAGKVAAAGTRLIGKSLEAISADGDEIHVLPV